MAKKATRSSRTATASKKTKSAKQKSATMKNVKGAKKKAAKRELINTGSDTRFVRRGARGKFKESDDVGTSLAQDPRKKARAKAKRGQGDKGDR
jgi:hypothetical protein